LHTVRLYMARPMVVECRGCRSEKICLPWTHTEEERVSYDEGRQDVDFTVVTGQCDDCLENAGPDELCQVPEEPDEAQFRAERAYRDLDRGEL
jgi:hypothetical protein